MYSERNESFLWSKSFDCRYSCLRLNTRKQLMIVSDLITKFWNEVSRRYQYTSMRAATSSTSANKMIQFQRVGSVRTLIEWSNFPSRPTGIEWFTELGGSDENKIIRRQYVNERILPTHTHTHSHERDYTRKSKIYWHRYPYNCFTWKFMWFKESYNSFSWFKHYRMCTDVKEVTVYVK